MKSYVVIITNEDDFACADDNVEKWYEKVVLNSTDRIHVATDVQFTRLRVAHKRDDLDIKHIEFNGKIIEVDFDGCPKEWPKGLFSTFNDLLMELF